LFTVFLISLGKNPKLTGFEISFFHLSAAIFITFVHAAGFVIQNNEHA
jgi:hypothetical protein